MKKSFLYYGTVWLILVSAFHLIVFMLPDEAAGLDQSGGAFWTGYACIMLAFIGQAVCGYLFFKKSESGERTFLNLPLMTLSYTGLILSVMAGTVCMAVPNIPSWLGAVVAVLILAFHAAAVISACGAAQMAGNVDRKIQDQTRFVRSLTADLQALANRAEGDAFQSDIRKLVEACRYSDPMSDVALAEIEEQIIQSFLLLKKAVEGKKAEEVRDRCEELSRFMADRNRTCKQLK